MKTQLAFALAVSLASLSTAAHGASIAVGPIINPANQHTYYLLTADTWTNSEAFAQTLGGHLVTINDGAENTFVFNNFARGHNVWIGLNDADTEGTYVWSNGESSSFLNWRSGQPDNFSTPPVNGEDYVHMYGTQTNYGGFWNDAANDTSVYSGFTWSAEVGSIQGVVEVPTPLPSSLLGGMALLGGLALLQARRLKKA